MICRFYLILLILFDEIIIIELQGFAAKSFCLYKVSLLLLAGLMGRHMYCHPVRILSINLQLHYILLKKSFKKEIHTNCAAKKKSTADHSKVSPSLVLFSKLASKIYNYEKIFIASGNFYWHLQFCAFAKCRYWNCFTQCFGAARYYQYFEGIADTKNDNIIH